MTDDDTIPDFSSRGDGTRNPDVVAPGAHVQSLRVAGSAIDDEYGTGAGSINDRYLRGSGTSQAAAVVSGAAAVLLQQRPDVSPDEVKALLMTTAASCPGRDADGSRQRPRQPPARDPDLDTGAAAVARTVGGAGRSMRRAGRRSCRSTARRCAVTSTSSPRRTTPRRRPRAKRPAPRGTAAPGTGAGGPRTTGRRRVGTPPRGRAGTGPARRGRATAGATGPGPAAAGRTRRGRAGAGPDRNGPRPPDSTGGVGQSTDGTEHLPERRRRRARAAVAPEPETLRGRARRHGAVFAVIAALGALTRDRVASALRTRRHVGPRRAADVAHGGDVRGGRGVRAARPGAA